MGRFGEVWGVCLRASAIGTVGYSERAFSKKEEEKRRGGRGGEGGLLVGDPSFRTRKSSYWEELSALIHAVFRFR